MIAEEKSSLKPSEWRRRTAVLSRMGRNHRVATREREAKTTASRYRTIVAGGILVTAVTVFAQIVGQWVDFRFFNLKVRAIDSNHHASVFGAASLLAQAAAATALALRVAAPPPRGRWFVLAGLIALLLILRTFFRHQATTAMLLGPLAVVFCSLWWLTLRDHADIRLIVWGALGLLMCSFTLHVLGPQAGAAAGHGRQHTWAFQLAGMLKHGAELAGWMLLATGMAAAASSAYAARSTYREART